MQPDSTRLRATLRCLVLALPAALSAAGAGAAEDYDAQTKALLIDAVEAAFEVDLYNSRCRSDQSGRHTENLNKELASRYRITVLDVQDDLFPEGYYRDAQARLSEDFLARLRDLGGCDGAKAAGLRNELGKRYDEAMRKIAEQP